MIEYFSKSKNLIVEKKLKKKASTLQKKKKKAKIKNKSKAWLREHGVGDHSFIQRKSSNYFLTD